MEAWEVMTSESQERMLAIVTPDDLDRVLAVCRRWEVRATVVGRVTGTGRLRILDGWDGEVLADVPAATLHEDAPLYHRPMARPADLDAAPADDPAALDPPADCGADLLALLVDPSWVYRQYDHQLFLNTVVAPGATPPCSGWPRPGCPPADGAAPAGPWPCPPTATAAGAPSTPGRHRLVVAESALNVACVGARPVALVNCLNFGNPEHPEVMWQLSEAIDGMAEACRALGIPVIGGNVSLYNESRGRDIDPTPVVGTLGLVDAPGAARRPAVGLVDGSHVVLLAPRADSERVAGRVAVGGRARHGHRGGLLPPLDLAATPGCWSLVSRPGRAGGAATASTTCPRAASAWPWPRWRVRQRGRLRRRPGSPITWPCSARARPGSWSACPRLRWGRSRPRPETSACSSRPSASPAATAWSSRACCDVGVADGARCGPGRPRRPPRLRQRPRADASAGGAGRPR